jgi:hypothetical protein
MSPRIVRLFITCLVPFVGCRRRFIELHSGFAFQPFIDRPICRIVLQPSDVPVERFKVRTALRICGDIRDAELFH